MNKSELIAAVAQASDGVVAGLTSINGSKKLANTMFNTDGSPMLKYFVLDSEGVADKYNIAFPKGSELVALFDGAIQEMIDSGEMEKLVIPAKMLEGVTDTVKIEVEDQA